MSWTQVYLDFIRLSNTYVLNLSSPISKLMHESSVIVKIVLKRWYFMRVNELSKQLRISADTVRFYSRIGFLTPTKSLANGYKDYSENDLQRLRFILGARQLGFSVEDIGQILGETSKGRSACPLVRRLIKQRLNEIEKRFIETERLRKRMLAAVKDWDLKPDKAPTGHMVCHLIEGFMKDE